MYGKMRKMFKSHEKCNSLYCEVILNTLDIYQETGN